MHIKKRGTISNTFAVTAFTVSLNLKIKQKNWQTCISSRRRGVVFSHKKDIKKLIIRRRKEKKRHYQVNFTRFLAKCEKKKREIILTYLLLNSLIKEEAKKVNRQYCRDMVCTAVRT